MAGKNTYQIGLQFTADTAQAKKQLQDLQKSLNELTSKGISEGFSSKSITKDLEVATADAIKLQTALQGAVNTNTGKLDISKFNNSLKSAGLTIPQLRENLSKFGAEGNKIFEQLALSITKAEKPALQLGNIANKLLYSFAQTARYQFSSSIYRGLIGGIRSAYGYAQDLNESLNRIRIVTGQSTDQMAKFAETANKAAQSLSVTTTEYTKGALIYYQQGLSDEEVKARTDVTMKLANASGVSAETASQQLTAVWNNFAKGSKDLEYFADVMVKLGATTASSTSEIAEGLEKFAAIGETVGLSYNYAAAALATVTATTRQSADVVGTAFKTLFARIQDLEVGETLEDGTTLGKYSQALAAIGINIKDANGDLKDMDKILDEMGSKWSTLSRDMQTAVAQTVAGTRQYTQLIALMENWDFMQRNINTAQSSRGSLEEQQQTYSEGWEAARDRVKAALQDIYQDLIDDKFFIDLLNFAKDLLNTIDTLIKHMGGLPGLLSTIGSLITTFGFQTVANGIDRAIQNIKVGLGIAGKEFEKLKSETLNELTKLNTDEKYGVGPEYDRFYKAELDFIAKLEKARQNMTADEAKSIELISSKLFARGEELKKEIEITKQAQEQLEIKKQEQAIDNASNIYKSKEKLGRFFEQYKIPKEEVKDSADYRTWGYVGQKTKDLNFRLRNNLSRESINRLLTNPQLMGVDNELNQTQLDNLNKLRELVQNERATQSQITRAIQAFKASVKSFTADSFAERFSNREASYSGTKTLVTNALNKDVKYLNAGTHQGIINAFESEIKAGGVPQEVIDSFNKYKELVESGEKDTEKLKEALEKLRTVAKGTHIEPQMASFDEALAKIKDLNIEELKLTDNLVKWQNQSELLDNQPALENYKNQVKELINTLSEGGMDTSKLSEALNKLNESATPENLSNLQAVIKSLDDELMAMSDKGVDAFAKSVTNSITKQNELKAAITAYRDALIEKNTAEQSGKQSSEDLENKLQKLREEINRLATETENGTNSLAGFTRKMQSAGQNITTVIRGITTSIQTFESFKGVTTEIANGTAKVGSSITSLGSSIMMLIPAITALGTAMSGPWGWIIGIVGAVVAIGAGIISGLVNADTELDKAKKKVDELKESYTDIKNAATDFKNAISNYDEQTKALDELIEGTDEYKEKVKEANEEAQKIIDQYEEQTGKKLEYKFNTSTGRIEIDPKVLEQAKLEIDTKELNASNELLVAKIDANNKASQQELKELSNNKETQEAINALTEIYLHNGHQAEAALKKLNETNAHQGELLKELNNDEKLYGYLDNVANRQWENLQQGKELNSGLSKFNQDYINHIQDEELKEYFKQYLQQEAARRKTQYQTSENEFNSSSQLEKKKKAEGYNELILQESGIDAIEVGKKIGSSLFGLLEDYMLNEKGRRKEDYGEENFSYWWEDVVLGEDEFRRRYLSGLDEETQTLIYSYFKDYLISMHNGDEEQIRQSAAVLYSAIKDLPIDKLPDALKEILNQYNFNEAYEQKQQEYEKQDQKNAEKTFEIFNKYFSKIQDTTDFILKLTAGRLDTSNFTLSGAKSFDAKNVITKDIARQLGWIYTDDEGNTVDLTDQNTKLLNEQKEALIKQFREITSNSLVGSYLKDFEDLNIEEYAKVEQGLANAFIKGGQQGVDNLSKLIKGQKDPVGIIEALNSTDWRTADFDKAYKQLKDLGYNINKADFDELAKQFKEIEENSWRLTASLEELFEQFKKIKDITDKLTFGAVISDDDYSKYIKDKDEFKDKFVWTINGWMYIGEEYAGKDKALIENGDIQAVRDNYAKAREDAAKISEEDIKLSDTELAAKYYGGTIYNPLLRSKMDYNGEINETALSIAKIDKEVLEDALATPHLEESKKVISAYADAIRELYETSEKYADKNILTMAVESQYKSVDKLIDKWNDLKETWGDTITDDVATQLIKIATINEAVAKGIDKDELIDYVKWLRESNAQLAENEELLYQVAVANKIAQKAFKETVSSYEANIEALQFDDSNSETYLKALDNLRQNLADMLSISVEELAGLDASFFTAPEIIELYKAIAEGDEKALQTLTANAMVRAGQIVEAEKDTYIEFLAFIATNPGQAEIDVWYKEHNKPSFLQKNADGTYTRTVAGDAAGLEYDRFGRIASQGSIFDYGAYKGNLNKDKKGKSSKPKELEDELDRYHHIKKVLEDIERELERVAKVKDRAYGAQHLKYLEQEISYLEEEVGLQDQYISQIEGYLGKDRGLIAAYGAQFDEYGNISNYDEMFAANFAKYANAEDSTNWENFKKALSKYEETMDLWQDEVEKRADLIREILDKKLEGISYKVEIEVALSDREIKLLEHQLNRLDDAAYDTAAALANIGQQFEKTEDKIDSVTNGIVETLKTIPGITDERIAAYLAGDGSALDGLDIEQGQIDLLEEYSDQLLELSDTLKELHDKALEQVSAAFDAWNEKIEDHIAKFEHLNNVISNYEEIIGLLGQSNLGITNEFMREMRGQRIANLQGELDTRTRVKDNLAEELAQARQKAAEAASDAEREDWEKVADDIEKRLEEATESWQEAWIAALQANKEAFEQTMQEIVDSFSNYENELKRYDAEQDRYLETYQQAYELSKLTRDIQNSINDQDSIRAKQELQKLETKINDIKKSGRQISQDELTLLQKEYELRLAEIALEDAQNAKSMVRLSRDNEGNWGYVYTADQDKIAEAEQKYEDKLYEYMRQADTMAESASRAILTLNREMAEALAALDANAEDYEEQVAAITEFYGQQIAYYAEQYNISVDAIETVAKESAARYKPEVVDIIESANSGLQTNFEETVLAIIGHFGSMDTAISEVMGGIQTTYDETIAAFQEYQRQNQETCELAGTDIEHMAQFISGQFTDIQTSAEGVVSHTQELTTGMKTELDKVLTELGTFASKYSEQVGMADIAATGLSGALIELEETLQSLSGDSLKTLQKLVDDVTTMAQAVKEAAAAVDEAGSGSSGTQSPSVQGTSSGYEYRGTGGDGYIWFKQGQYYTSATYGGPKKPYNFYSTPAQERYHILPTDAIRGMERSDQPLYWRQFGFATGGYTGEWGSSGKIGVLHEKELVLNQTDTQNILDAVSLIRKMTAGTAQLSSGLGNIGAGLNNLNINPGTMDQNVQINASFPNVSNHYEIEEALNNLVNKASQYAFRPVYT